MEKFIEIHDDIISPLLADYIENNSINSQNFPFFYIPNITLNSSTNYLPGLSNNFFDTRNRIGLFNNILYQLGSYKNFYVTEIISSRVFLHLPSPNPGPDEIHVDLQFPHWVCLYYINDSEGDTILFNNKGEEIKRVTPKKGRIVFFDGSIKHCSSRPAKLPRAIINFDFRGEKF